MFGQLVDEFRAAVERQVGDGKRFATSYQFAIYLLQVGRGKRFGCAADFARHQLSIAESFAVAPLLHSLSGRRKLAVDHINSAIAALKISRPGSKLAALAATNAAIEKAECARLLVSQHDDDGAERYLGMAQDELKILQRE